MIRIERQAPGDVFERLGGHMVFPEDRVTDRCAAGTIACRLGATGQHGAAQIGDRTNEGRIASGVRSSKAAVTADGASRHAEGEREAAGRAACTRGRDRGPVGPASPGPSGL